MRSVASRWPRLTSHSRVIASSTIADHPQRLSDARIFVREFEHGSVGHRCECHGRDGAYRMVHLAEDKHTQITKVARHEVGHDLATAIREHFIAASESIEQEVDLIGRVTFTDDVLLRPNAFGARRD